MPLFAYGPGRPVGLLAGPQIGWLTARALGLDLLALNHRLLVDARQALPEARIDVQEASPGNSVVKISLGAHTAELPVNKNLLILDDQEAKLEGLVICAPPATVTILHDAAHPSSLLLPVLPDLPPLGDEPVPLDQQTGLQELR